MAYACRDRQRDPARDGKEAAIEGYQHGAACSIQIQPRQAKKAKGREPKESRSFRQVADGCGEVIFRFCPLHEVGQKLPEGERASRNDSFARVNGLAYGDQCLLQLEVDMDGNRSDYGQTETESHSPGFKLYAAQDQCAP